MKHRLALCLALGVAGAIHLLPQSAGQLGVVAATRPTADSSFGYQSAQTGAEQLPLPLALPLSLGQQSNQPRRVWAPMDVGQLWSVQRLRRSVRAALNQAEPQTGPNQVDYLNQLPELIAQAHNEKPLEARALLKKLIQAHFRPEVASYYANGNNNNYPNGQSQQLDGWQDVNPSALEQLLGAQPIDLSALKSAALLDDGAALASQADLANQQQQDQYQNSLAKREYLKPCSFNAVSCAKNPFRKL